jgi:hypothetical protein
MGAQDDWGGEMGAESLSSSSEDEPSCSEALRRMAELVQGAREGAQGGLQDGYALLQELEFEGLPVNTVFFNDFLRVAVELAKGGQASTVDGERIVERLEREGLEANEDTYLQMMLLIAAGAKHKDPEPKGFLSEGYQWLAKMDKQGLNISEPVVDAYIDIYHAQMPNVYELDPYEHNWCVNTDSEEALWQANAELGIEPHIKTTYTPEVPNLKPKPQTLNPKSQILHIKTQYTPEGRGTHGFHGVDDAHVRTHKDCISDVDKEGGGGGWDGGASRASHAERVSAAAAAREQAFH